MSNKLIINKPERKMLWKQNKIQSFPPRRSVIFAACRNDELYSSSADSGDYATGFDPTDQKAWTDGRCTVVLFSREKLHLSDAGYTMLDATHQIYETLNKAADEIQQTTSATQGSISIGILASIESSVLQVSLRIIISIIMGLSWRYIHWRAKRFGSDSKTIPLILLLHIFQMKALRIGNRTNQENRYGGFVVYSQQRGIKQAQANPIEGYADERLGDLSSAILRQRRDSRSLQKCSDRQTDKRCSLCDACSAVFFCK